MESANAIIWLSWTVFLAQWLHLVVKNGSLTCQRKQANVPCVYQETIKK